MGDVIRTFEGALLLNTKTGAMRVVRRKVKMTPFEVLLKIKVDVEEPEQDVPTIEAKIRIPKKQFRHIVLDSV